LSAGPEQTNQRQGRTVLVTGSEGFIGRNLCQALRRRQNIELLTFDLGNQPEELGALAAKTDLVFHLAGVNRPQGDAEFMAGNAQLTRRLCECLASAGRKTPVVLSSSIQAELPNAYGASKRAAEEALLAYHEKASAPIYVYRFPNVFGKWSRPNYNTVVATFCYNLGRGLPVQVSDAARPLRFVYIGDVVKTFLEIAARTEHDPVRTHYELEPVFTITLGELHDLVQSFQRQRLQGVLPDLANPLTRYLHSTFLSFLSPADWCTPADIKADARGHLFELFKSKHAGQVFVSTTRPGITRGNHYHDTKVEKFVVIHGEALIRLRDVRGGQPIEVAVSGRQVQIVDIPPGYTHSIENVGKDDLITLFWANEIFDPEHSDTWPEPVLG
jgi:UDP-2-acetamido-2,6-beta-L-arabino-hexul-4-ose reductase